MTPCNCIRRFAALALCLALALLALPGRAAAAEDLSLTLSFQPEGSPAAGVTFTLYQVGQQDGQGGIAWLDSLADKEIDWNDQETLAAALAPYAGELISARTGQTGQDGQVTFSALAPGAYLVMGETWQTDQHSYTPVPALICLPSQGENHVSANVKHETDQETPENPDNPDSPTTPTNPTNPGSSGDSSKPTLPQTGQLWWPVPLLACGGMVCFLAGWVKNRRDYES